MPARTLFYFDGKSLSNIMKAGVSTFMLITVMIYGLCTFAVFCYKVFGLESSLKHKGESHVSVNSQLTRFFYIYWQVFSVFNNDNNLLFTHKVILDFGTKLLVINLLRMK